MMQEIINSFEIVRLLELSESIAPQKDAAQKEPSHYAAEYYAAINKDDIEGIKGMYSKGYYKVIVTKNGFLKTPDEKLFEKHLRDRMFKHTEYLFQEDNSGFHDNNAEGVYSYVAKVIFTDEYKKVFEEKTGSASGHIISEVVFKLEDDLWSITDKSHGY